MENKQYDILIKQIDLKLLREQKQTLLDLQYRDNPDGSQILKANEFKALEGIISLIDHIQDEAVEQLGLDENEVFDLEKNEE
jgi:hypothetical protein